MSSITGISTAQYDFTSLTTKQAFDAAKDLFKQGVLSQDAADRLGSAAQGVDYAPVDRTAESTKHTLADPAKVNWLSYFQQSSD